MIIQLTIIFLLPNIIRLMNNSFFLCVSAFMLSLSASADSRQLSVSVSNDLGFDKVSEPVVVRLSEVKKLKFEVTGAVVSDRATGERMAVQLDDMDGDGCVDEVFFLADVKAKSSRTFDVCLLSEEEMSGKNGDDGAASSALSAGGGMMPGRDVSAGGGVSNGVYVALQLRDKKDKHPDVLRVEAPGGSNIFNDIYMHGVTLETDLVGYRIYFDHRQNIDLYGKKYRRIELPETQFYTTKEQLDAGYGVDVLWAGNAIGCGSFKDWKDGGVANWTDVAVRGQRVVTAGRLRAVVDVYDLGVTDGKGGRYDVHQYYSIYAGRRDMRVDVVFDGKDGRVDKMFCTGVQKVGVTAADSVRCGHSPYGFVGEDGLAASWGCDYPDMGKKQLWGPEPVGLAVYVPIKYVKERREDELNYLYVVGCDDDGRLTYYVSFAAGKEDDGPHCAEEWMVWAKRWKESLE